MHESCSEEYQRREEMLLTGECTFATNKKLFLLSPRYVEPIYDSFSQVTRVCAIQSTIRSMLSLFINLVMENKKSDGCMKEQKL